MNYTAKNQIKLSVSGYMCLIFMHARYLVKAVLAKKFKKVQKKHKYDAVKPKRP
ncbi:unnamed protein product [Brassica oleracea]